MNVSRVSVAGLRAVASDHHGARAVAVLVAVRLDVARRSVLTNGLVQLWRLADALKFPGEFLNSKLQL